MWEVPKDKDFIRGRDCQCDDCGGNGCNTCDNKGWLPPSHERVRFCARPACSEPLEPDNIAVYCSSDCAFEDA